MCETCNAPGAEDDVVGSLRVLREVVALQAMPAACVDQVLLTLCRAVCVSRFNAEAGQLVQHLGNTSRHMGILCYRGLVRVLQVYGAPGGEFTSAGASSTAAGESAAGLSKATTVGNTTLPTLPPSAPAAAPADVGPPRHPHDLSAHLLRATVLRGAVNILSRCGWRDLSLSTVDVRGPHKKTIAWMHF